MNAIELDTLPVDEIESLQPFEQAVADYIQFVSLLVRNKNKLQVEQLQEIQQKITACIEVITGDSFVDTNDSQMRAIVMQVIIVHSTLDSADIENLRNMVFRWRRSRKARTSSDNFRPMLE
jgi:hypothetical protein